MLKRIAWRNVWRSRGRSLVVIGSVVVGIWALLFGTGFMNGFMVGYMSNIIENEVSNMQVHHPDFSKDFEIKFFIPDGSAKAETIRSWEGVRGATTRTLVTGMISSPKKAQGIQIRGIDLENEAIVTSLDSIIVEGDYFESISRNPIVIGQKLAESLKVKVRSKVVLTFNDGNGDITAAAFRVCGIVKSTSVSINEMYVFVRQEDIWKVLDIGSEIHEIAAITDPMVEETSIVEQYESTFKGDLAETWKELAPELALMQDMYSNMLYILLVIIMLALIFGIINTMLMAVLERIKELGMLMAVGMTKIRVFGMVLLETIYLALAGAPFGLLAGYLTISYYNNNGVDLSEYSEGLEAYGYSSLLYPYLEGNTYVIVTIGVIITAFLGAIYPAYKAVKLNPVEALHKI